MLKTRLEELCARRTKRLQAIKAALKEEDDEQEAQEEAQQEEEVDGNSVQEDVLRGVGENGERGVGLQKMDVDVDEANEAQAAPAEGTSDKDAAVGEAVTMDVDCEALAESAEGEVAAEGASGDAAEAAVVEAVSKPPPLTPTEIAEAEARDAAVGTEIFNDVTELVEDALVHVSKGKLSEIERKDLLAVLLHLTVTDSSIISEECATQAEVWRQALEGKRKRTAVDYKSQGVAYQDVPDGSSGGDRDAYLEDNEFAQGGRGGRVSGSTKSKGRGGKKSRADDTGGGKGRARRTSRKAALKGSFNDDDEWDFERDDETTVIYGGVSKDGGGSRKRRARPSAFMVDEAVGGLATNVEVQVMCDSCQTWCGQDQHGLRAMEAASLAAWHCAGCTSRMHGLASMCETAPSSSVGVAAADPPPTQELFCGERHLGPLFDISFPSFLRPWSHQSTVAHHHLSLPDSGGPRRHVHRL